MKKIIVMAMLVGCLAFSACGKDDTKSTTQDATATPTEAADGETDATTDAEDTVEKDTTPITDETIADKGIDAFMTMGEYKGIELTKTVYTVTDEDIDNQIATNLSSTPMELTDPNATIAEGDTVNMSFVGKVDGTEFDGGTVDDTDVTFGSSGLVEGFEDQLIGWKTGQQGDINITFPDDYSNEDLQGKDAVYSVTINKISRPATEPTTEWLAANADSATLEDYRASVKTELETNNTSTTLTTLQDDAWNAVFTTAKFTQYPQEVLDECVTQQKASYESYAQMYGMEYDAFMEASGITEDDITEAAKNSVQNVLAVEYICEKESITEDSETYQNQLNTLLQQSGMSTKQDALDQGVSEWNIDFVVKYNCAINTIIDNAKVTEVKGEDVSSTEDGTTDESGTDTTEAQ